MLTDADCENALRNFNTLNDALGVLSYEGVERLLEYEKANRSRSYMLERIVARLSRLDSRRRREALKKYTGD